MHKALVGIKIISNQPRQTEGLENAVRVLFGLFAFAYQLRHGLSALGSISPPQPVHCADF